jgi:prepilin-type N-terminal cleavage/methylation domain-containing protein
LKVKNMKKNAFTLIELLVVISVLGVLVAVLLPNLIGIRSRARDSALKNDMRQLKVALRTYYNDFQAYPDNDGSGGIAGCGDSGSQACPNADGSFASGNNVYMKEMIGGEKFTYVQLESGEDFLLSSVLENASDSEVAESATRCGVASPVASTYYVCAD